MNTIQLIQIECWTRLINCLGTSHIFGLKAGAYKKFLRLISILGIIIPLTVGGVVITYGDKFLFIAVLIAGPILLIQLILSGFALLLKTDDLFAYCLESQTANKQLFEEYKYLAQNPKATLAEMKNAYDIIYTKEQARNAQDDKINFSEKENRKGMRYALKITQKPCASCNIVPTTMKPSNCETCGNF